MSIAQTIPLYTRTLSFHSNDLLNFTVCNLKLVQQPDFDIIYPESVSFFVGHASCTGGWCQTFRRIACSGFALGGRGGGQLFCSFSAEH